jgi:hypothetical protein
MISLLVSGVGLVLFVYGRKEQRLPQLIGGVALMVYPYAVESTVALVIVGAVVTAAVWVAVALGW